MKKLNDYLYSGDTVLRILQRYSEDLKHSAKETHNQIDLVHCNFLLQIAELLQHNDFLTSQSQRIREFYKLMATDYDFLAFTFKGRIKSLIRAESKFNGYIVEYIYEYYIKHGNYPSLPELKSALGCFRDLIAYRIVISLPKCHLKEGQNISEEELKYLYKVANQLPGFLEERGFSAELAALSGQENSHLLDESVRPYYRDYIVNSESNGYQSLHITFYDIIARCYVEVQLRTKEMDDFAEIGPANHLGYEKRQESERARRDAIPVGENIYFDDAYERGIALQQLELSKLDVNMFSAMNNSLINDGCGLFRGRQILPFEHLSRFQNDIVD
ncbi:guanosine polyphosphate pyrophosphohydrolase [Eubacteriaceae bacterium ES3]|nr:guanosine polyphosphate pyrophosphohydrolase [Eubacteriaceae bacterium ES3]